MINRILVPLDGSPFGEQALPLALTIASRAGARLDIVFVHEPLTIPGLALPLLEAEDLNAQRRAYEYLDKIRNVLASLTPTEVRRSLRLGDPVAHLCEFAEAEQIDLVVMSTHGRGPLSRYWLGSVSNALLRRLSTRILLVRAQEDPPQFSTLPEINRVLIPLDGSCFAEQVLEPALTLARLMKAQVRLLRVVPPSLGGAFVDLLTPGMDLVDILQKEAMAYLEAVRGRFEPLQPQIELQTATASPPAVAILNVAQEHQIDLIALATHGFGGLASLFLGSVADKVVRGSTVPVMLNRPSPE